jgi:hypothetical protein
VAAACLPQDNSAQDGYGLFAKIYDASGMNAVNTIDQVFSKGIVLTEQAYFMNLNMVGGKIQNAAGENIKNHQGQDLSENYGLESESSIILDSGDDEGYYQLAVLSNDAVQVDELNADGSVKAQLIASPPSNTRNKLSCAGGNKLIDFEMKQGNEKALRIKFIKVSSDETVLVMLWRKVRHADDSPVSGINPAERLCNTANPKGNVVATLLDNSWLVLKHKNFKSGGEASCPE